MRAILLFFVSLLIFPSLAFASGGHLPPYWGPIVACAPGSDRPCDLCELLHTGVHVIAFLTTLVVFVLVPIMLIAGGVMFMISSGSEAMLSRARRTLWGAVIGGVGALAAYALVSTVLWLLTLGGAGDIQVSWPDIQCGA